MASKQVSEILIKLGIDGLQGLDKLKSSFRELEKSIGPSASTIERARESIIAYGREGKNSEQVIRGQIEALKGLQSQAERGSSAWNQLAGDIERFRQASRRTDSEINVLRESILSVAAGSSQSQQSLRSYITDLGRLRSEATITGSVFNDLGKDIAELTVRLQQAEAQTVQTSRAFGRVLGQALASTSAGARKQLQDLKLLIDEQQAFIDNIDSLGSRERRLKDNVEARAAAQERLNRALAQQRQLTYQESIRFGRQGVVSGAAAFNDPLFSMQNVANRFGDLPDTTAALNQELAELSERLLNTNRGSTAYVDVANRMAQIQRELRTELTGTTEAFRQLGVAQAGVERRAGKLADIQEYYRTQGPLAPGVGGYRDPVTGAMIMAGSRTPGRIRVDEAAYQTPIGPQPFPEAGKRAQESIQRSLDEVNRIYEDARIRRSEIQAKYNQLDIDKLLQGLDLEGQVREKAFKDELAAFDRQLEARDRRRRRRLTTGQAVQSAGAIISGGIFGGPEGFLGGLGGFAAGLAIPGLGPVGGAFAGAAGGAQVGAFRQQLGIAAQYAAEIRRLQLALQGVVTSFEDYRAALAAIESASKQFNIPIQQSTQQFTKLSAAVIGSGGTIKDAENTFKGLSASVLATGGSIQDVNGALVAAAQVFSKGKLSAEELRGQIGERLAGAFALFAESSGKSTQKLDADLQDGEVTLQDFVQFVEFSLKKYGRTAQIIADSPEQAGARLDLELKRLQKNVGDALGPAGAAFQDFAARSVRGIDKVINKLIELRAIQPGAGYYQQRVLGREMSIADLENQLLAAGSREAQLRAEAARGGLPQFIIDLLPKVKEATKEVKILEEALIKLRLIEKETNKEQKQRRADEANAEKEKLGQKYLQAVEQREEALYNARRQREEQIAQIRKNAIEQAAQIERQLADERRNIERDMERVRREMQAGSGEIDRLRRLAQGEDPRIIEAERAAAQISQQATEDRIKIEEDLLDKELQQQRTIADLQKNTAKQIADANENYAKRVGEIQRDFAKASAKVIEEGSGRAAKRITLAAQIVSQVLQRTSLNQQRTQFGLQPIGEPTGFVGGRPVYGGLQQNEVPDQIKRIDQNLEQLLRKLSAPQGSQGSLPNFRMGSRASEIGEQFISLLQNERGYEDVAGLLPLPIQRMQRQAARPLRMVWERIQGAMDGIYGATERQIKKQFKPDPVRNQQVLQRIQKTQEAILNWNPLEAQWKEAENQMREQKRSKPSRMPVSSFVTMTRDIHQGMSEELRKAGALATRASERTFFDFSDFVSPQQQQILTTGIKEALSAAMDQSFVELRQAGGRGRDPSAMPAFEGAIRRVSPVINQFRELFQQVLSQEAASGHRYAQEAMKKFGMQAPVSEQFYRSPAYRDPGLIQERLDRLYEQPRIQPGVEGQFEGAMLPGRSFNISKLSRTLGSIATASTGSLAGYFPAVAQNIGGTARTTQMRRQSAQQQIEQVDQNALIKAYAALSEIKSASQDVLENFQLQNREIELQIDNIQSGMDPALAGQLAGLQSNYEVQQQQLEITRQALINAGLNEQAVNQAYVAESNALSKIYEQNQAAIAQYEEKRKVLEQIQSISNVLESNLTTAISDSIQVLVTGSGTVKQVLADMFASVGRAFIQMAAQIIAKQLAMIALGSIMRALGLTAGASGGRFSGGYFDPSTGLGAAGPNFGLAKGGYFANGTANLPANSIMPFANGGIVNKPTFFKFANGGAMSTGVMGEAGPEAIMPLKRGADGKLGVAAKLDGAMQRYRRPPGTVGTAEAGTLEAADGSGAATTTGAIDVRYTVERINSVDYVTADQFQAGLRQAAEQGARRGEQSTLRRLQQSTTTRRKLGM